MTSTASKPKLDTLPNEIIQQIWPLSGNLYLPLASRRLYAALNSEHVQRTFYRTLAIKYLAVLNGHDAYKDDEYHLRYMGSEGITAGLLTGVLERSEITNADIWDISEDLPETHSLGSPYVWFIVPEGTKLPQNFEDGEIEVFTRYPRCYELRHQLSSKTAEAFYGKLRGQWSVRCSCRRT